MRLTARYGRVLAMALAVTVAATACSSGDTESSAKGGTHVVDGIKFPQPEMSTVKLGLSGKGTIGVLPVLIAAKTGIFKKYGVDVKVTEFSGASQASQALLAGQVDVGDNSGGPVISSLATGAPEVIAFVTRDNSTDIMFTAKNISNAAQLKGKSVAVSSFGSQSYAGALLALKSLGLTPKDVTITQVGNDSARLAALKSGSVGASMQDHTLDKQLTGQGFHALVRLSDVKNIGGVIRTSLTVPTSFADKNPNTMLALVAGYLEAETKMRQEPDQDAKLFAADAGISLSDAQEQVKSELAAPWTPRDGRCNNASLRFMKQVLQPSNARIKDVDPTKACTNKYLDKLNSMGFQKKIGVPGY